MSVWGGDVVTGPKRRCGDVTYIHTGTVRLRLRRLLKCVIPGCCFSKDVAQDVLLE